MDKLLWFCIGVLTPFVVLLLYTMYDEWHTKYVLHRKAKEQWEEYNKRHKGYTPKDSHNSWGRYDNSNKK